MTVTGIDRRFLTENVIQLLDEHHVAVLVDGQHERLDLADDLVAAAAGMPETDVQVIEGGVDSIDAFCSVVERAGNGRSRIERSFDGVIDALRAQPTTVKRRYIVWRDAETMLEADVALFGALVDAMLVVATAHEHLTADRLVVFRLVLFGGPKLGAYAEDEQGQFVRWLDGRDHALSRAVSRRIRHPGVLAYRVDG